MHQNCNSQIAASNSDLRPSGAPAYACKTPCIKIATPRSQLRTQNSDLLGLQRMPAKKHAVKVASQVAALNSDLGLWDTSVFLQNIMQGRLRIPTWSFKLGPRPIILFPSWPGRYGVCGGPAPGDCPLQAHPSSRVCTLTLIRSRVIQHHNEPGSPCKRHGLHGTAEGQFPTEGVGSPLLP